MLATTARGDAYTFAEYEQVFARAGFRKSEFRALPPTNQQAPPTEAPAHGPGADRPIRTG